MTNIKFSVVIPLFNKEKSIKSTLKSVLEQTFTDFEVIIVNDGSTDNTLKVIQSFSDPRIRIINKINGGVSSARNTGIENAKYDWISFIDGDDLWCKEYLECVCEMIERYDSANIISIAWDFDSRKNSLIYSKEGYVHDYFKLSCHYPLIWSSSVTIKKDCFEVSGKFDEGLKYGEDLEMWSRLLKQHTLAFCPRILSIYRLETENRTTNFKTIEYAYAYKLTLNSESKQENNYKRKILNNFMKERILDKDINSLFLLLKRHGTINFIYSISQIIKEFLKSKLKKSHQ